jgi:hypothetical protein
MTENSNSVQFISFCFAVCQQQTSHDRYTLTVVLGVLKADSRFARNIQKSAKMEHVADAVMMTMMIVIVISILQ